MTLVHISHISHIRDDDITPSGIRRLTHIIVVWLGGLSL